MTLGAMQPYLFPYLGYFQLMDCVDIYVFCGGLQYIRCGWVNRNRLRMRDAARYFTFSVAKDDHRKNINQRHYSNLKADCDKLKREIFQYYKKAVNFEEAYSVLEEALAFPEDNVAGFNINADSVIARYLGIQTKIVALDLVEDEEFCQRFEQSEREERCILLCRHFNAGVYVNAIGGTKLYHRDFFAEQGIRLQFLRMNDDITYDQCGDGFVSSLSIIDVLMRNRIEDIKLLLKRYRLE